MQRCLVVAVRPSTVCIGVASHDDASSLVADFTGRVVLPLDALPFPSDAVKRVLAGDPVTDDAAVTSWLRHVRAFAESRVETEFSSIAIVLPQSVSSSLRNLIQACARAIGFHDVRSMGHLSAAMHAYGLGKHSGERCALVVDVTASRVEASVFHIDEGIFELIDASASRHEASDVADAVDDAVEAAASKALVALDSIEHLLFTGEISHEEAASIGTSLVFERLSTAAFHNAIAPAEVATYGAMDVMRTYMRPPIPQQLLITPLAVFTIGLHAADGLCEPLIPRWANLPSTRRTAIRVFCGDADGTAELAFCEGQRAFARDNLPLGVVHLSGMSEGWNDVLVRVDMTSEYEITIYVTSETVFHGQLSVTSAAATMEVDEIAAYFDAHAIVPTLAQEQQERERLDARQCTRALVTAACHLFDRDVPTAFRGTGSVEVRRFELINASPSASDALFLESLDQISHSESEPTPSAFAQLHTVVLRMVDERIEWLGRLPGRCCFCTEGILERGTGV